jgi:hypothetical protein
MDDFANYELSTTVAHYVLQDCKSEALCKAEKLGIDAAEAAMLDDMHECLVDNSYFRVWRMQQQQRTNLTIWCLARDGSVLKTVQRADLLDFKLVVKFSDCRRAVSMLRSLDNSEIRAACGDETGEPELASVLRNVLHTGQMQVPFRCHDECVCEYWDAVNADFGTSAEGFQQCMECHHIGQNIFHVFSSLLASTMLRLQERYECPNSELRGRCFSLAEYKAWERQNDPAHGFIYYERWPGFNVPGSIVKSALYEDNLSPCEQALKQALTDALSLPVFYVIATQSGDESSSLYHEVCHAMYEVNAAYRADVDAELATIPHGPMSRMKAYLRCEQYANVERILQDEVHAYLSEGDKLGCSACETAQHTKRLQLVFSNHADGLAYLLEEVSWSDWDGSTTDED